MADFEVCASIRSNDRLRIHFSFDLLVGDAWCFRMLIDEWARVYDDLEGGRKPPEELRYRDYALALESLEGTPLYERDLAYWRKQLETLPPAPQLPMVQSLSGLTEVRSQHWSIRLNKTEWANLKRKLARERLTASGFLRRPYPKLLRCGIRNQATR
ncbi:hypothetical protein CAI21_12610 [Alkalilimnicola ehrlichii]|uniref:Condensation domain-containing protein n=1 Tax=Alkalilimnicola ehrlichii TaxID=351052 RepID=A0A3E0X208_9GAMM|nr:condensation domain-containing protein [Alkalilimnicola ehrlichii]RFA28405.1 hypothetical protein CAI21_12610 [Alkalilimnicola ehrlichii]RFA38530.1 hypothetical protein CAL65_04050 [Alkalilimnicola ehrlichii]